MDKAPETCHCTLRFSPLALSFYLSPMSFSQHLGFFLSFFFPPTIKVLKGHDDHVITCLQFCGNRIVSGSDDNTLKVWSAITGKVWVNHLSVFWVALS